MGDRNGPEHAVLQHGEASPKTDYKLAVKRARTFNLNYRSAVEISEAPIDRIVGRITHVTKELDSTDTVKAVLGGIDKPNVLLKDCLKQYWEITKIRLVNKSPIQIRKWRNPRLAGFMFFIDVLGKDKAVQDLQRSDILKFHTALRDRIAKREILANTANKNLGYVKDILATIALDNEIDINFRRLFEELKIKMEKPPWIWPK